MKDAELRRLLGAFPPAARSILERAAHADQRNPEELAL